jgi:hypothetical protein
MTTTDTSFTATGPADNGFQTNGNFSFGVTGIGNQVGVFGDSDKIGVAGTSGEGNGVGVSDSGYSGVVGRGTSGAGVVGRSESNTGVFGITDLANGDPDPVLGDYAVAGVVGIGDSNTGVAGTSTSAYGGAFQGGLAPLRLEPSTNAGRPTTGTHRMGEFYVDNNGVLYFCTANGTPGTWKTVMLAA